MEHVSKTGESKPVSRCTLPLTGRSIVNRVVTDLGVFDPTGGGFAVIDLAPGVEFAEVVAKTAAPVTMS
jgi:3-oxoacid CoA-transferase subunit B